MKKILCLSINRQYTNNTQNLFLSVINTIADVTFYGPGYVTNKELKQGINDFIDKNNVKFDFIFTDGVILFWNEQKAIRGFNSSYCYFKYDSTVIASIYDMKEYFINSSEKKKLFGIHQCTLT